MSASDYPRIATPLSSSPNRPSALSRPDWPWALAAHHRYSQRSSSYSLSGSPGISPQSSWDPSKSSPSPGPSLAARHNTGSTTTMGYTPLPTEDSTRQWSFIGFEWVVRDVQRLRDYIEGGDTESESNDDDFELLKQSPMIGENKYKLEIARTHSGNEEPDSKTLSMYITSLALDFAHPDYEMSASMMAAIKCQDDRAGERGARPEWVWEYWQNDWVFRQESEVWACPLPLLSTLLENSRIQETDSLVISVQIHCPLGPFFPSHPSAYYVPRDLLDGLEASLDNPNTGDIRFVCLERLVSNDVNSPDLNADIGSPTSRRSQSSASSHTPFSPHTTARKRVIYAHSDILTRRSEYFATMLASSFAENQSVVSGERKLYTIVVEEADYETIYWLLKYCYANWLLFKEHDDPRLAVEGIGAGWSAKWLRADGGEWDWKTFHKSASNEDHLSGDGFSVTSGDSVNGRSSPNSAKGAPRNPSTLRTSPNTRNQPTSTTKSNNATSTPRGTTHSSTTTPRRPSAMSVNIPPSSSGRPKQPTIPLSVPSSNYTPGNHYPVSPRSQRSRQTTTLHTDPHPHPTPSPPPASALAMYQVAHRYGMPALANLALEHMMSTLTPQSSFALLLATSAWDELRSLIEDYVVEKWEEVNVSEEFEHCCQEVSAGEWGPEGGQTLMALFRRLRSPSVMGYTRA